MARYYALFDFVLFVRLDENYNLGYSLIRRIPEVVVDVTAFATGAGSGSGVRNASGRPYQRHSSLRRHSLWNGFCGDSLLARPIANAPYRLVVHANSEYSLLERIRYWHRTPPLIGSEAEGEVLWKTANELRVGVLGNR